MTIERFNAIKLELEKCPGIKDVSAAFVLPPTTTSMLQQVRCFDDPERKINLELLDVDKDFIKTFGIKIIEGNDFSKISSSTANKSVIMTKSALKNIGLFNDELGKQVDFQYEKFIVVGIIEDIHIHSLHKKIIPTAIIVNNRELKDIAIRVDQHNTRATLEYIRKCLLNIKADDEFAIRFFNELNDENYTSELRLGAVVLSFTIVSALIACMGLIGLSLFVSKQRTKEIGIRKVLGASSLIISKLFFKEFLLLLLIANILAVPLGIFISKLWLQNFAYKAPIQISMFFLICLLSCVIVLISISIQILRSSLANPAESLKYE